MSDPWGYNYQENPHLMRGGDPREEGRGGEGIPERGKGEGGQGVGMVNYN